MKTEIKTISLRTIEGIIEAQKLKADGWKEERLSLFTIQFTKQCAPQQKDTTPIMHGVLAEATEQ